MPIFHCNVKTHSRTQDSANHAVRSAAYRAGTILVDEASGNTYNYSRKSEVTFSEIVVPANAPEWARNRTLLWNNVEKAEKRVDAVLFREIEVALPKELAQEEYIEIIREYVQKTMTVYGIIVDYSIHNKEGNPHCHLMLTLRNITPEGFGNKNRDWNDKKLLFKWRQEWEKIVNAHLAKAGIEETIDCRSLKAQGVDRLPTVHEGREGIGGHNTVIVTQRRQRNRRIREHNNVRSELRNEHGKAVEVHASIKAIDEQIAELNKPEPMIQESKNDIKLRVGSIVFPKNGKTLSQILKESDHVSLPKPNPFIHVKPVSPAPIIRSYSLAPADLLNKSHQIIFGTRPNQKQLPKISALPDCCMDLRLPNGKIIYPENHDALKQAIEAWSLSPSEAIRLESKFWTLCTPEYYEQGIKKTIKTNAPKIDPNILDCFTEEDMTYYKSKGVGPKEIIEYTLRRNDYVGITKQVKILHRGIMKTISSCNEFYDIHKNATLAEKAELDKKYWSSIDTKTYCLQLFDVGIALGYKPDDYDPFTVIRYQQRGINPKDFAKGGHLSACNRFKTPQVIRNILTGNSSMRDYGDILSYSYKRNMIKGDFDNLIIPWWNQFVYADYYDEARRLAFENNIFLKFDNVTSDKLQEAFNNKTPPIDFINSIAIGGAGGTGNGGYEYEEGFVPKNAKKKDVPPTNLTTGQSVNPDIISPEPQPKAIKIPWTQLPEEPKPYTPSNFNPSNEPLSPSQIPEQKNPRPPGYRGSSTPKPW